jgi:hypothetical protein
MLQEEQNNRRLEDQSVNAAQNHVIGCFVLIRQSVIQLLESQWGSQSSVIPLSQSIGQLLI